MKTIFLALASLFSLAMFSQNTISGTIINEKGKPIAGANIYIEGTYDGATSSETGGFSFETSTKGNQFLIVSFLIYDTYKQEIDVANFKNQTIKLTDTVNALDAVVITAGKLESGN